MKRMRAAAALVLTGAVLPLAGCTPAAPARPVAPKGLHVVVLQYRSDIGPRGVQLEVVNGSTRRVVVRRVTLARAGWTPGPSWRDDAAEVGPGATVDLPAKLTRADCTARRVPTARLDLRGVGVVSVPTTDSHDTLTRLHADDCFAETAARTASFRFTELARLPHDRARLRIAVAPGPDASRGLEVTTVLATTLLAPAAGGDTWHPGVHVDAAGPASIGLMAVPNRCDLHAIAEDKIGSVLPLTLRLADGTRGTVNVVAPPAVKQQVISWVSDTCATGRGSTVIEGPGGDVGPSPR